MMAYWQRMVVINIGLLHEKGLGARGRGKECMKGFNWFG